MNVDLRSKNNNLKEWKKKKNKITEVLLERAIGNLKETNTRINQKNVSIMMKKIATNEEKDYKATISSSGISKNEIYKTIVFKAGKNQELENKGKDAFSDESENRLETHRLKIIIARKESKIKEYESIIKRANINKNIEVLTIETIDYRNLLLEFISLTLKEGIVYKDEKDNLRTELDNKIVLSKKIFNECFND